MRSHLETHDTDPFSPPPPTAPFHDPASGEWVLSRYADVLAAFREPRLQPVNAKSEGSDVAAQARLRSDSVEALSAPRVSAWQAQLEPRAYDLVGRLPSDRPVDVVQEFAQPWSLDVAVIVTGADWAEAERLRDLAREVSAATADPSNSLLQSRGKAAGTELARRFDKAPIPMPRARFRSSIPNVTCVFGECLAGLAAVSR